MLLGRPANLILGAITGILNVVFLSLGASGINIPPEIIAAVNLAAAAIIGVVAYQPPTLNPGDTYSVVTPAAQPNQVQVAAVNPPTAAKVA